MKRGSVIGAAFVAGALLFGEWSMPMIVAATTPGPDAAHAAVGGPQAAREFRVIAGRLYAVVTARLNQAPVIDKIVAYGTTALLDWHLGAGDRESLMVRELGVWKLLLTTKRDGIDYALLRLRGVPKERALRLDYYNNRQCVQIGERDLAPELAVRCNDLEH